MKKLLNHPAFGRLRNTIDSIVRKPEIAFLSLSVTFGILFVFLTPPLQAPDEQAHYLKAYQISQLQFLPEEFVKDGQSRYGGTVPVSVHIFIDGTLNGVAGNPYMPFNIDLFSEYVDQELQETNVRQVPFEGASIYSPIAYMPQAIGMFLGRTVDASPLVLLWIGRIFNLATWILMVFIAIKIIPFGKWLVMLLALNPLTLFLAASLSADAVTIGLAYLLISTIFLLAKTDKKLSIKYMLLILAMVAALSLTKPINFIFALSVFLIPTKKFKNLKKYFFFCCLVVIIGLFFGLGWNMIVQDVIVQTGQLQRPDSGVNPELQLSYLLDHPFQYFKDLIINYVFVTAGKPGNAVLSSYFGTFGWMDTQLPLWTIFLYVIGLVVAALYQYGRGTALDLKDKIIAISIFMLGAAASITALYLNYTKVGASIIEGVQGRYFMPYAFLLVSIFTGKNKLLIVSEKKIGIICISIILIVLLTSTASIVIRYYH